MLPKLRSEPIIGLCPGLRVEEYWVWSRGSCTSGLPPVGRLQKEGEANKGTEIQAQDESGGFSMKKNRALYEERKFVAVDDSRTGVLNRFWACGAKVWCGGVLLERGVGGYVSF